MIDISNALHEAMLQGKAKNIVGGLIDKLVKYTIEHFQYEEGRLEACNYPDLSEHRKKHADLVEKVRDLHNKTSSGKKLVEVEMKKFLKSWLTEHIQRSDKKYAPYLQAQRISGKKSIHS